MWAVVAIADAVVVIVVGIVVLLLCTVYGTALDYGRKCKDHLAHVNT